MKRLSIFLTCLLFTSFIVLAQSGMTDSQLMEYVMGQSAKGMTRQQIVLQLLERGADMDQIQRVQRKSQAQIADHASAADHTTKDRLRQSNGDDAAEVDGAIVTTGWGILGHDDFNNKYLTIPLSTLIATLVNLTK